MEINKFSFRIYLAPDGSLHDITAKESRVARNISGEERELKPGGMIVLSTDVNALVDKHSFISKAKGFLKTWYNRMFKTKKVDEELSRLVKEKGLDTGWSIGNLFRGRYYDSESKQIYNEKSMAIEIRGVDFDFVKEAGKRLGRDFEQKDVLIVDHSNGRTFLVGTA